MSTHDWLQYIDHTGDVGFIVRAPSLPELFSRAAIGMFEIIADMETVQPREKAAVEITAGDVESLLVRWLSELNFRHITQEKLFCRFDIANVSPTALKAEIFGEPIRPEIHIIYTEIKATTYHGLYIKKTNEEYESQIIFDL